MAACRFVRRALGTVLALTTAVSASAGAKPWHQIGCPSLHGVDLTNSGVVLLRNDKMHVAKQPCRDEECRAINDIMCTADAYSHEMIPNTMNYRPEEFQIELRRWRNNLAALGEEYQSRIPLYCKLLTRIAPTITGRVDGRDDTADFVMTIAVRLNRPSNRCLEQVVAAVPKTEGAQNDGNVRGGKKCLGRIRRCQADSNPFMW